MTEAKFYKRGAEAELSELVIDGVRALSKKRIPKGYRNVILDERIRRTRSRSEVKLLKAVSSVVNTPKIISFDENNFEIVMEFIDGVPLKEVIEKKSELCALAGKCIRKIHDIGVIHGDLTTSNIIYLKNPLTLEDKERVLAKGPLFFVDFGLGYFSRKVEDRAADLVVFKKTFNATHSSLKNGWELVIAGYAPDKELVERMAAVEKRARYH